jgi:hypothetical protein
MEFISQQKTRLSSLEFDCYRAQFSVKVSIPKTSGTVYTGGDMGDTLAAKGFSALSTRHVP